MTANNNTLLQLVSKCVTRCCNDKAQSNEHLAWTLINRERAQRSLPALPRNATLDQYCASHVKNMVNDSPAKYGKLSYWTENNQVLRQKLESNIVGETVQCGTSVMVMHDKAMKRSDNILNPDFDQMGIALAQGSDGTWFMMQLFRATPPSQDKPQEQQDDFTDDDESSSSTLVPMGTDDVTTPLVSAHCGDNNKQRQSSSSSSPFSKVAPELLCC